MHEFVTASVEPSTELTTTVDARVAMAQVIALQARGVLDVAPGDAPRPIRRLYHELACGCDGAYRNIERGTGVRICPTLQLQL